MIRIVHLSIKPEHCMEFESYVLKVLKKVQSFPGCSHVQLLKGEIGNYFTFSEWESANALEVYRQSPIFNEIWDEIKPWFAAKAEAWSTHTLLA